MRAKIVDWSSANAFLGARDSRAYRGIRFTRVHRNGDGSIAVEYHDTDVVTYRYGGRYEIDTGGYHTMTTRARIRQFSPLRAWGVERGRGTEIVAPTGERRVLHGYEGFGWDSDPLAAELHQRFSD